MTEKSKTEDKIIGQLYIETEGESGTLPEYVRVFKQHQAVRCDSEFRQRPTLYNEHVKHCLVSINRR